MKKMKSYILIFLVSLVLCGCSFGTEIYRYDNIDDIKISHNTETVVAKITIEDTYKKDGQKFYEITTSVTGNKLFTYSEDEYDKLFGLENDAFDCEIYSLCMNTDVLLYEDRSFSNLNLYFADELINYKDNSLDINYIFDKLTAISTNNNLICNKYSNDRKKMYCKIADYYINTSVQETRYSFEGSVDFTDEEIENYKKELNELNLFIIEAFDAN